MNWTNFTDKLVTRELNCTELMPNHFELWTRKPWKFTNSSGPGKEAYISAGNSMLLLITWTSCSLTGPKPKCFLLEQNGLGWAWRPWAWTGLGRRLVSPWQTPQMSRYRRPCYSRGSLLWALPLQDEVMFNEVWLDSCKVLEARSGFSPRKH